jgi:L-2-hydroxyglutarate oxidase
VSETGLPEVDAVVIGAGIVGLASARALQARRPGWAIAVLDKEPEIATHQSGHNSGVIHSGIYYAPGSAKARWCATGRARLLEYCRERGIRHEVCGKVIVATNGADLGRLAVLADRSRANGVEATLVGRRGLSDLEPHAEGLAALHVPSTGVIDFRSVVGALARDLTEAGGHLGLATPVIGLRHERDSVQVITPSGSRRVAVAVSCAGLHSDRLAAAAGDSGPERIVAFRGEYHDLVPESRHLVRHLVYPVPDPRLPFLGVHLTRSLDGHVHVGPNAVLALGREAYGWHEVNWTDVGELVALSAVRGLARRYWRSGAAEVVRSMSRSRLARAVSRLVPGIGADDLTPAGAGVRAQAVRPDGTLVDDFVLRGRRGLVHVVNAPSPAATAALAIGEVVAARALGDEPGH